jgi:hypothetical protein
LLLPSFRDFVWRERPQRLSARVAAAPRIVTRDDQHSQQLLDSFPGKHRLNFLRLAAKKPSQFFGAFSADEKKVRRGAAHFRLQRWEDGCASDYAE